MQKIAISGLNATDNPAPGISVAKSLQDEFEIIGLSYNPNEPGNYLDAISKSYLMPYPSLGIDELLIRLEEIKEKENLFMLIPCLDLELPLYIKYQEKIEALGIKVVLPSPLTFDLRNKNKLPSLAKVLEVNHPKTYELSSLKNLEELSSKLNYPFMLKGNAHQASKVESGESAKKVSELISREWGFPLLLQEIIKGDELNLVAIGDGKGNLIGAVTIKKLTTTTLGKIWTGVSIHHTGMMELAQRFVKETSWRGAFELECMIQDNKLYLIEINPRFPSWIYFATAIGVNLPKQLVNLVNNVPIKDSFTYPTGKLYVRFTDEIITDFSDFSTLMIEKEL